MLVIKTHRHGPYQTQYPGLILFSTESDLFWNNYFAVSGTLSSSYTHCYVKMCVIWSLALNMTKTCWVDNGPDNWIMDLGLRPHWGSRIHYKVHYQLHHVTLIHYIFLCIAAWTVHVAKQGYGYHSKPFQQSWCLMRTTWEKSSSALWRILQLRHCMLSAAA